jgi:hypothetical protein
MQSIPGHPRRMMVLIEMAEKFTDNSQDLERGSLFGRSCALTVIELDDFDSYFAGWDHSGQPPGSCSDRPCQHLYQSQSSPFGRKGSYHQTSRNLYSSRLNYPAQLSHCCSLRYCPRSSLHWIQHRSHHRQHRRPHPHRRHHRLGRARRCSGRARISIQWETVFLST